MARKLIAGSFGAAILAVAALLLHVNQRLQHAREAVPELCRRAAPGQSLAVVSAAARQLDLPAPKIRMPHDPEDTETATVMAGAFTDAWVCDVEHDGQVVLRATLSRLD